VTYAADSKGGFRARTLSPCSNAVTAPPPSLPRSFPFMGQFSGFTSAHALRQFRVN
jgi:hypothetical protein